MNTYQTLRFAPARRRAPLIALATVCGLSVVSAVLVTFHLAGPQHWLADSPAVQMAVAQCPAPTAREARAACLHGIVARRLGEDGRPAAIAVAGR